MANARAPSTTATFSRGIALWWQQAKLFASGVLFVLAGSLIAGILVAAGSLFLATSADDRYLALKHLQADLLTVVPMANRTITFNSDSASTSMQPAEALAFTRDAADSVNVEIYNAALYGGLTTIGCFVLVTLFWMEYGRKRLTDHQVRGARLVKAKQLKSELVARNDASPYRIAGVPMRRGAENLNTLIAGAQGTGKSRQFFELMAQVRARRKKAVVYDSSGEFTAAFYREGKDVILNPLDARSPNWNPWREIHGEIHYDNIAEALIPLPPKDPQPFFAIAARMVFKDSLRALGQSNKRTNAELYKAISRSNLDELHALLIREAAATYVDPVTERTGMSLKMTVQNQLDSFRFLHDEGEPFSIREWTQKEDDDSWLFITVNEEQKSALLPVISLWCDVAIQALLSLDPIHAERFWYFYDELPGLQKLEIMKMAVTGTRKFGGCFVLGLQDFSQLFETYGDHLARTIISGCQTKLLLRVTDGDSAKALVNAIGQADIDEKEENATIGIDERRDSMSVFARRNLRDIVLASEILRLPDMEGYLVTPGDYPVARVKYGYVPIAQIATPFVPRQASGLWLPPSAAPNPQIAVPAPAATSSSTAAAVQSAPAASAPPVPSSPPSAAATAPAASAASASAAAGAGAAPGNLIMLPSGEVVDADTGEVQGRTSGEPDGFGSAPDDSNGHFDIF
ncbi:type IV secretion system DNA-binding domain-containing protein (plasmid) [Burkholderia plantarii]|uniref:type IV secretion system DNA-binding domain-containing protein n=1 Tax=Burkholderia plantarii TaxID=41899 RepID=UPI00272D37A3|nr:type IV secretion system DNA-binding domain-containing protein [Burkholderia plantarii]WLE64156.1 type IV secretion system DNA-binding domain-containing protein [Burkholderia plantarii]